MFWRTLYIVNNKNWNKIAQFVKIWDLKASCITDMGSIPQSSRDVLLIQLFQCRLYYGVHTALLACINICEYIRIPSTGSHTIVWT